MPETSTMTITTTDMYYREYDYDILYSESVDGGNRGARFLNVNLSYIDHFYRMSPPNVSDHGYATKALSFSLNGEVYTIHYVNDTRELLPRHHFALNKMVDLNEIDDVNGSPDPRMRLGMDSG